MRCNQHERRVDWSPIIIPFSSHYCLITRMFYIILRNMHSLCVILYILSFIVYYTILSITFIYFIISIYIYIHYITFYYIILSITFHIHIFIELHGIAHRQVMAPNTAGSVSRHAGSKSPSSAAQRDAHHAESSWEGAVPRDGSWILGDITEHISLSDSWCIHCIALHYITLR
jgi:hypothetical protein